MKNIKLWIIFLSVFVGSTTFADSINDTTSRSIRTEIMCRVATEEGLKPHLLQKDNIMISDHLYVFVDLTGDDIPELIAGSFDETFKTNNPIFQTGNAARSRSKHQYYFYSSDETFRAPKGTKFSLATTMLVNDYNGDAKNDVFFVQHGPDYSPKIPQRNEVMLSDGNSFKVNYADGPKSLWNGGTSGDIDLDGDIDIIVTPGPNDGIWLLENLGNGKFKPQVIFSDVGRNYRVQLWDIDKDGHLDLLFDGHETDLMISWGAENLTFRKPTLLTKTPNSTVQDFEFADINSDGRLEIITMSSLKTRFTEPNMYYGGFELSYIEHSARKFEKPVSITRHVHPKGQHSWLKWISACDLKNDGKIDIVYEKLGEGNFFTDLQDQPYYNWSRVDRVVWENLGGLEFSLRRFEDPAYFSDNPTSYRNTINYAKRYGLAHEKYTPSKSYNAVESNKNIFKEGLLYRRNGLTARSPYTFSPIVIE